MDEEKGISTERTTHIYWLVVWNVLFSIYWECHHPNWRFVIFFRGVGLNHQPVIFMGRECRDNTHQDATSQQWLKNPWRMRSYHWLVTSWRSREKLKTICNWIMWTPQLIDCFDGDLNNICRRLSHKKTKGIWLMHDGLLLMNSRFRHLPFKNTDLTATEPWKSWFILGKSSP